MPMTGAGIGAAMLVKVDAYVAGLPEPKNENIIRSDMYEAMGEGIVEYIQANGYVQTSVPALGLVAPVGGGPVTGTAKGTGTVS